MVKVYDMVLTFDTGSTNEQITEEVDLILNRINEVLARAISDSLPQLYKDSSKKPKIAVVPIKQEDFDD